VNDEAFRRLLDEPVDWRYRAFPTTTEPMTIGKVAFGGWNVLAGDLPLPALVLKERALHHNIAFVARWCREHGILHAPHGKTTMAPQIFRCQLDAGAWAITVATVPQLRVCRAFGVEKVVLANELVEPAALRWLASQLDADAAFEVTCLVDSVAAIEVMETALAGCTRRVPVLVELGFEGGRSGCRTSEDAAEVARAAARSPALELAGTEAYEGLLGHDRAGPTIAAVDAFLDRLRETTVELARLGVFEGRERVIVSAGGSAYLDRVAEVLGSDWPLDQPVDVVVRAGAYVTHDVGLYARTSPFTGELRPALEVWAAVLSRPERDLAIAGLGKRDVSHDVDLPSPMSARGRDGRRDVEGMTVTGLNDQHAYVRVPPDDGLEPGDVLGFGISHPCTAFDKWRLIPVVDDDYRVVDAVATFF
jgi:D-serine deaminase-like pyridoxal phosphate-dependent protein